MDNQESEKKPVQVASGLNDGLGAGKPLKGDIAVLSITPDLLTKFLDLGLNAKDLSLGGSDLVINQEGSTTSITSDPITSVQ